MAKVILLGKSTTGVTTWASNRRQLMSNEAEATGTGGRLENALHQSYATFLNEPSRPPSTGGKYARLALARTDDRWRPIFVYRTCDDPERISIIGAIVSIAEPIVFPFKRKGPEIRAFYFCASPAPALKYSGGAGDCLSNTLILSGLRCGGTIIARANVGACFNDSFGAATCLSGFGSRMTKADIVSAVAQSADLGPSAIGSLSRAE
jgi:hypothetical protein